MKYEIYRLELEGKIRLCTQQYEDVETFKTIAKNHNYMIYENGKDITERYKEL